MARNLYFLSDQIFGFVFSDHKYFFLLDSFFESVNFWKTDLFRLLGLVFGSLTSRVGLDQG